MLPSSTTVTFRQSPFCIPSLRRSSSPPFTLRCSALAFLASIPRATRPTSASGAQVRRQFSIDLNSVGLSLLAYGYAELYLPQRQFLLVRLLASLSFPVFSAQYLLGGHLIYAFGMKGFSTTVR